MPNIDRQAVIVLGMHRSGTSAVAGTAVRLGLAGPLTQLPASADNPGGFYESHPVVRINHQLLRKADCAWNVCLMFDPDRIDDTLIASERAYIVQTLVREFGDAPAFVMKDPRLCLTLPAWMPALTAVGTRVAALIVIRHPAEVVRSLAVRNQLGEADTAPHWLHHMLEAERVSRGLDRAVVLYDDLLRDWRSCIAEAGRRAGINWPRPIEQAGADIDRFLLGSSRHHSAGNADAMVGPASVRDMINAVWIALRRLADNPQSSGALDCLDHVRVQFAAWRRVACPPGSKAVFQDNG